MIHETQWSPDTCSCVHRYEWDDAQPESSRTHTFKGNGNVCAGHAALAGQAVFAQVEKENRAKNNVREIAAGAVVKLRKVLDSGAVDLADNVTYNWSFTGSGVNRTLVVSFAGVTLSNAEKTAIRTAITANLLRVPVPVTVQ